VAIFNKEEWFDGEEEKSGSCEKKNACFDLY
jgi:hypothetical protein